MTGYSGTPLPQKLGIRAGARVALVGAPDGFLAALRPLPVGACVGRDTAGPQDVILLFATERAALERNFLPLAAALVPAGGLWVIWPKRASGVPTDLTEDVVREVGLAAGMVDNKVCAVDEIWSGLRFVVRLADRPKRARALTKDWRNAVDGDSSGVDLTLRRAQAEVDETIMALGGYWPPLANLARLFEECGELARAINQAYGPKRIKASEAPAAAAEELGDILYVLLALANSAQIDAEAALAAALGKARRRAPPAPVG